MSRFERNDAAIDKAYKDLDKFGKQIKKTNKANKAPSQKKSVEKHFTLFGPPSAKELRSLRKKEKKLTRESERRAERKGLKRNIRRLQTERYAKPLISGGQRALSLLQSGYSSGHGARRMNQRGGLLGSVSGGSNNVNLLDMRASNKEGKNKHYLEF